MRTRILLLLCIATFALGTAYSQELIGRQLVDEYPISQYSARTYGLTWLPADYSKTTTKYPLLIFLHGSGEGGDGVSGLRNLLRTGLPQIISNGWNPEAVNPVDKKNYKFIVVSPQAPSKSQWSYSYTHVRYILEDILKRYRIDESRIYITGLSAGGGGSWSCVTNDGEFTKRIAAITPISATGVNNPSVEGKNIPLIGGTYGVKVWAVCGMEDGHKSHNIADVNTINNAKPAPAVPAAYTLLPGLGHVSAAWNTAYSANWRDNQFKLNIFEWMLQYRRDGRDGSANEPAPVPNKQPVANAGANINLQLPANTATLDGSKSSDPDGSIKSYLWTKISGPAQFTLTNANSVKTSVSNLAAGSYVFELTVTDDKGLSSKAQVTIVVSPAPNKAPVANAGTGSTIRLPENSVELNGSASSDPDGTIKTYQWRKLSGPAAFSLKNGTSAKASVSGLEEGTYTFELTVTDNAGASAKATVAITVLPQIVPPVAFAGNDQEITLPENEVRLSSKGSYDPGGNTFSSNWSKLSGPASINITNPNNSVTALRNLVEGAYRIRLTITNSRGAAAYDTITITVKKAAAPPPPVKRPVANAGPDQTILLPENEVRLSSRESYDPDGNTFKSSWSKLSGPASITISNPGNAITAVRNLTEGVYRILLTITTSEGKIATDTVNITVKKDGKTPPTAPPAAPPTIPAATKLTANAGPDQTILLPASEVILSSRESSDPDGGTFKSNWSKISGPASIKIANPNNALTAVRNLEEGTYSIRLTITNNAGATGYDTVQIHVRSSAPPPPPKTMTADAGGNQSITLPANEVRLSSRNSSHLGGLNYTSRWSKVSGPASINITNPNNAVTALRNLVAGSYRIALTTTDVNGLSDADTITITVHPAIAASNAGNVETGTATVLQETMAEEGFRAGIYPNPVPSVATLTLQGNVHGKSQITLYSLAGKRVYTRSFIKAAGYHQEALNLSTLAPGIYFGVIETEGTTPVRIRIVKM